MGLTDSPVCAPQVVLYQVVFVRMCVCVSETEQERDREGNSSRLCVG